MSNVINVKRPEALDDDDVMFQEELSRLTSEAFANASSTRTLKNIKETLSKGLKKKYKNYITSKEDLKKKVDDILKIHGLSDEHFDVMSSFSRFVSNKLNDESIDANANKCTQGVKGLLKEIELPYDKLIGYDYLYRTMKELYGQEEAKRLSVDMFDYSLGLSDSSGILCPYCYAMDASKIVLDGRDFGQLPSKPAKTITSYIGALNETVHQLSNHLMGAVAVGTFFLDIAHILMFKQRIPLKRVIEDKDFRKYIENNYQMFVHSVNSLTRNGIESPFTNISIFDKEKLHSFIADDNYGWYFPKKIKVISDNKINEENDYKMSTSEWKDFVVDYIFELQKIFIDWFDKGDPTNNGLQYRFPVLTVNVTKTWNEETNEFALRDDNELLEFISHKDVARYNIFVSEGTKIASCCRMINDTEMMDLGSTVNSFGGSGGASLGSHRVCTINFARIAHETNSFDEYLELLKERVENSAKILKAHKVLLLKMTDLGLEPFIKNGWINMKRMFSTFGVLGIYEADKILKQRYGADRQYTKEILQFFSKACKEAAIKNEIIHNIEQIPGESFAPRLASADKIILGNPYDLPDLYANQFVPLWEDVTIYEKMDREGEMDHFLTGGSIAHIQIGSDITSTQFKKLIKYAVKAGCEHFALNAVYLKCNDCGCCVKSHNETCPKCGSKQIDFFTRVIGFFSKVSDWNKTRREWEFPKRKFTDLNSLK